MGACDLAEVLGSAVALNLMLRIPLLLAVIITGLDVLLLLALQRFGMRTIKAIFLLLIATISVCYFIEISPADSAQFSGNGAGSGFTALSSIGDLISRHRYHRRDRDAPQPVPAFCPSTGPQATEGRTIYPERDPLQRH
jgi:hypothetical protein